jgi:hypothetical protein
MTYDVFAAVAITIGSVWAGLFAISHPRRLLRQRAECELKIWQWRLEQAVREGKDTRNAIAWIDAWRRSLEKDDFL